MRKASHAAGLGFVLLVAGVRCGEPAASADSGPALVAVSVTSPRTDALDSPPSYAVVFRHADGRTSRVDRHAIALVHRWRDGAALIDPARRLYQVWPDGRRRMLAAHVHALATDGERLAFAQSRRGGVDVRVHNGSQPETLATGFSSAYGLEVARDGVHFTGTRPGGRAARWRATSAGAHCEAGCTEPIAARADDIPAVRSRIP